MIMNDTTYATYKAYVEGIAKDEKSFAKNIRGAVSEAVKQTIEHQDQRFCRLLLNIMGDNIIEQDVDGNKINRHQFSSIKLMCRGITAGLKRFMDYHVFRGKSEVVNKSKVQSVLAELKKTNIYKIPKYVAKNDSIPSAIMSLVNAINDNATDNPSDIIKGVFGNVYELIQATATKTRVVNGEDVPYKYSKDDSERMVTALAFLNNFLIKLEETEVETKPKTESKPKETK